MSQLQQRELQHLTQAQSYVDNRTAARRRANPKILEVQHPNIVGLDEYIAPEDACTRYVTHGCQIGVHSANSRRGANHVGKAERLWLEPDRHGAIG